MGLVKVDAPGGEWYSALERGVAECVVTSATMLRDRSLHEVTEYLIDVRVLHTANLGVLVNLDAWNRLPKHLQDLMVDTWAEMEPKIWDEQGKLNEEGRRFALDKGMIFIKVSPEDAKWFHDAFYEPKWAEFEKRVSAETYAKLRELLKK